MESVELKLSQYVNPDPSKKGKLLQPSTIKNYMVRYSILVRYLSPDDESPAFLLDFDRVVKFITDNEFRSEIRIINHKGKQTEKYLQPLSLTTKKTYYTSILGILNSQGLESANYKELQNELLKEIAVETDKNKKSKTQEENWTTIAHLQSVIPMYESLIDMVEDRDKYDIYKKWIIAMLYVGQKDFPPFRLNYSVDLIDKTDYDKDDSTNNYLVLNKGVPEIFHFSNYKNSDMKGIKRVRIHTNIAIALQTWLKHNKSSKHLLLDNTGKKMTEACLGLLITRVFNPTGKHITLNTIRHIFISENIDVEYNKRTQKLAKQMGHSTSVQTDYFKH